MAHVLDQLKAFVTGSGIEYPVVFHGPLGWRETYVRKYEVKTDDVLHIGDFAVVDTSTEYLAVTGDQAVLKPVFILDTDANKKILSDRGVTVSKTAAFKDGEYVDCVFLVPTMILSVKIVASGTALVFGSHICTSATAGQGKLLDVSANDEPAADLGYALLVDYTSGTGVAYILMMVT